MARTVKWRCCLYVFRFKDLMDALPLPEYTRRDGSRNLVSRYTELSYTKFHIFKITLRENPSMWRKICGVWTFGIGLVSNRNARFGPQTPLVISTVEGKM